MESDETNLDDLVRKILEIVRDSSFSAEEVSEKKKIEELEKIIDERLSNEVGQ